MFKVYQRLLLVLAQATEKELTAQVQYLKAENQILRARLPKRILVTPVERRRLLKLGRALGAAINRLITIVTPGTFVRWIREANRKKPVRNVGRPKHRQAIRDLVLQIAKETGWGYTRVLGELRKLTKRKVSRQTVANIMRENGLDARKVFVSKATAHPNSEWVVEQANAFCRHVETEGTQADLVFHDSDRKLCQAFDDALQANGMRVRRLRPLSPNLNAFVERWIQSIKQECLDHFIVLGETHLNHLVSEYVHYYQTERPHQGIDIGNELLIPMKPPDENVPAPDQLVCRERLGGLLKSYSRRAA